MIRRIFVESKKGFALEAESKIKDLKASLRIDSLKELRVLQRYDIEGLSDDNYAKSAYTIFCEAPIETLYEESFPLGDGEKFFAVEYLPGQFDQRADSAEQCVQIIAQKRPKVKCAKVYAVNAQVSDDELEQIKKYLVNTVDSRVASNEKPDSLDKKIEAPKKVKRLEGFINLDESGLKKLLDEMGLAMSLKDVAFCQNYFKNEEKRDPSLSEIRVLDTYWSDHCRHTTFLTVLENVKFESGKISEQIEKSWKSYLENRKLLGLDKKGKDICLMDLALIPTRIMKSRNLLLDLEESEEINAASISTFIEVDGKKEEYLVMFKNETHNHPTEIEPFGGAATCLGGAIRDPLSGRSYVYQAMRVTGAADPRKSFEETLAGKLPQKKITRTAAQGYSSYGNQIGLATGQVSEVYHQSYEAKRLEIGAVVAAGPREQVLRLSPLEGDLILLVGGRTGRDGIGGATGSSKDHNENALENSSEVQKGDAPMERKLQRLFRNKKAALLIKRCNDFGAGGVSVAIGELAPSLEINLDAVTKKYDGLDGTELAISESQERMAVVVSPEDAQAFAQYASEENLECNLVAKVTNNKRLVMTWQGDKIVNLSREFLDTNGTKAFANALIVEPKKESPFAKSKKDNCEKEWLNILSQLNVCSQKGLIEMFDSSIGASAVLHPFGGKYLNSPTDCMCSKIPLIKGETNTSTIFSWGFNPYVSEYSPYHGAMYAVIESLSKIASVGGDISKVRLTFQEYFEKLRDDPARWGKPLAALLGALTAQDKFGIASIGGKDSMSGSFKNLDVVPTLVSFAISIDDAKTIISPEFKKPDSKIAFVKTGRDSIDLPDFEDIKTKYAKIYKGIKAGKILSARPLRSGGIAEAVSKSCFGNMLGFKFEESFAENHFDLNYGSMILELADNANPEDFEATLLGKTTQEKFVEFSKEKISLEKLLDAWESPLETIFPTKAFEENEKIPEISFAEKSIIIAKNKIAKPTVFIPTFPGSNCEYDTAKAFENAGAKSDIFVFKNLTDVDVKASIEEMAKRIEQSQILMIPGGFSAGDEPAGSGKFIAAVFRNPILKEALTTHIKDKKNLVLGICNGFQALIKLGLVPYGEVKDFTNNSPTLTYNNIGRHISCYAKTKIVSKLSPWFSECELGQEHIIALSHGEGKFVASKEVLDTLIKNGQVATQYVDNFGNPSNSIEFNPNGSTYAIEGISSPCGLVLGKMGHSERIGENVGKNIYGNKFQEIFLSGVKYFL